MPTLKEQIGIIDEEYLAGISNRGIVNRSQKDLAGSGININLDENTLEAAFADGTIVKITESLTNYKCSCPSRSICKHAIMALLKASGSMAADKEDKVSEESASEESKESPEESTESSEGPAESGGFDYLLSYTRESFVKEYGKSAYNDILFKIISGEPCEIEEGAILVIKIMKVYTIRFLPGASVAESVCSCKNKSCRHRLEAILHYIKHITGKLDLELVQEESNVDIDIIPKVSGFIEEIFRIGLMRLPADFSEKCSRFAVLCHGAGFAVFERLFETCARELALYEQKNAGFNKNRLLRNLTRVYQICNEIRNKGNEKSLAGTFRRQYMELPELNILGLGAYPWYAKSGFCGVTAVFYAPRFKQVLNFSSSRPVESEKEAVERIEQTWHSKSAWNLAISFSAVSRAEISLLSAKMSHDGRLSSSEQTVAVLGNAQAHIKSSETESLVFDDFSKIKNLFSPDPDGFRTIYAVLKIAKLGEGDFCRVTQTYSSQLIDKFDNCLPLTIRYSKINETAIMNFEYMEQNAVIPDAVTVSIGISDEDLRVTLFPIAVWLNAASASVAPGVRNIGEKKMFSGKEKSRFAKFFV